jgi:replication factor C subunit 1
VLVLFWCSVPFLTEDGLFDLIRKSKPAKAPVDKHQSSNGSEKLQKSQTKSSPAKVEKRGRLNPPNSNVL